MDRSVYDNMAKLDEQHWWYVARRDVLDRLIRRRIQLPRDARILEIGCGTGHNIPMLRQFGEVDAIEIDAAARDMASQRLGKPVMASPLPALEGVEDGAYDMVAILDVLEHIEADRDALTGIAAKLKPGGRILITVPAHPWMWSAHDEVNHHKRRYTRRTLKAVIGAAGLRLDMLRWFNSLLFPVAAGARLAGRLVGKKGGDDTLPPKPVNFLFGKIFALERHAIGRLPMTPGVSLAAIVSVPERAPPTA
jgi:2-polyprenyl-3-methyl-5-hydroxy-6-metoxy-1,4-benzoquinol methylase